MSRSRRAKTLFGILAVAATARWVDVALVGAGVATAGGSVVFAGAMMMRGDHSPSVNGLEYLAIFARPNSGVRSSAEAPPASAPDFAGAAIDPAPVGSIGVVAGTERTPAEATGARAATHLALIAAEFGFAWVREGARIVSVRPGDSLPGLGRVSAIARREGRWTLVGDGGAVLLSSPDTPAAADARSPFARSMIFGPDK